MYGYSILCTILIFTTIFYLLTNRENFINYSKSDDLVCEKGKCTLSETESDFTLDKGSIREFIKFRNNINKSSGGGDKYDINKNIKSNRSIQEIYDSATKN